MARHLLVMLCVVLVLGLVGCKKRTSESRPQEQSQPVKTASELKAEAQEQITEKNMDAELDKLEKEINQEPEQ